MSDEDTIRKLAAKKGQGTLTGVDKGTAQAIATRRPDLRPAVAELLDRSANSLPTRGEVQVEGGALDNMIVGRDDR